jgi:hypothetical protein
MARPLPPFDAEFALVAACALGDDAALDRAAALAERAGFDWERAADLAFFHGVELIMQTRLEGTVPAGLAARIQQASLGKAALQAAQTATTVQVMAALAAANVRSVLLKGVGLAHRLYAPHAEQRISNDIDILVAPGDLATADAVLREAAFKRSWPEHEPPAAARAMLLRLAHVFDYRGAAFDELVELHCRPTLNPYWLPVSFDDLWAAASEVATPAGTVRALDGPLDAHYLCQHALYTLIDFRLKWFADIARAVRRGGAESAADYIARFPRPLPPGPGRLADDVLAALAAGIERTVSGGGPVHAGADAARIVGRMTRAEGIPAGRTLAQLPLELAYNSLVLRHLPGWRGKARQLLIALSDPRDALTLRLGPRFAPVYALAGPVLSLLRFARRSANTR